MIKSPEYEPYLTEYDVVFHEIFTLIDPAMNTSEIKPLHLAVPRNRQGLKMKASTTTAPSTTTITANNTLIGNQKGVNNDKTDNNNNDKNFSQRYLKDNVSKTITGSTAKDKPNTSPAEIIQQNVEKMVSPSKAPMNAKAAPEPTPSQQPPPVYHPTVICVSDQNKLNTEMLIKNDDFWLLPLSPSAGIRFRFYVEGKVGSTSGFIFRLALDTNDHVFLSGKTSGNSRSDSVSISYEDKLVGETRYTAGNSAFYAGVDSTRNNVVERNEAAAAVFNPSFTAQNQPRIFDFLVPALKKIDGKSKMYPIALTDTSGLVTRLSQMSKEAIRLKTRIPTSRSNTFDMTFEGKFDIASITNFVLFHDSNFKKDICAMGMVAEGVHFLEISYPLSPLQGFIAAMASTIPV